MLEPSTSLEELIGRMRKCTELRIKFLRARGILTGEIDASFAHQAAGKYRRVTERLITTYIPLTRSACEGKFGKPLPKTWQFKQFPDGRGGEESIKLFLPTNEEDRRRVEYVEERGLELEENLMSGKQIYAGQGENMYSTALKSSDRNPCYAVPTLEGAQEEIDTVRNSHAVKQQNDDQQLLQELSSKDLSGGAQTADELAQHRPDLE